MAEIAHSHISRQSHISHGPIFSTYERKKLVPTLDGRLRYVPDPDLPFSPAPQPQPTNPLYSTAADPAGSPGPIDFFTAEEFTTKRQALLARQRSERIERSEKAEGSPLVSNDKSPRTYHRPYTVVPLGAPETYFQVYHRDVYVCRSATPYQPIDTTPGDRKPIIEFSDKSAAALDHLCTNSGHLIRSQFCLTYHQQQPTAGQEVKRHLDCWLKRLRRLLPTVSYLWVLEFQKRLAPHFHVFLSVEKSHELGAKLARAWVDITKGSEMQLAFHAHPNNFLDWKMDNGKYILKEYCLKKDQKEVPEAYTNVGRFWGASFNFYLKPEIVTVSDIAEQAGQHQNAAIPWNAAAISHYFAKCLKKYHEHLMNYDSHGQRRRLKNGKVQPRKRSKLARSSDGQPLPGTYRIKQATPILRKLIDYVTDHGPDIYSARVMIATEVPF